MKRCLVLAALIVLALLLTAAGGLVAAQPGDKAVGRAPDHILVKFLPGTREGGKANVHAKLGGKVVDAIPGIDVQVVEIPANKVAEKVGTYRAETTVQFAEPDYVAEAVYSPNDPMLGQEWGLDNTGQTGGLVDADIDAPEAWDVAQGSSAVKIAILDTGIDQDHEDLGAKIAANKNLSSSPTVDDLYGHGTHVAGIAAAGTDNGLGVAGIGFNTSLMNVKVLNDSGSGYYSWVANGIVWAADNGAKVVNLSLGGSAPSNTLKNAVNYAWNKGVVVVAAAGNSGSTQRLYPAYYSNCIAVAATDSSDAKASFSNYGRWVDVAAPGVGIVSTMPNHSNQIGPQSYGALSGTSMATPFVGGAAALVWSTGYGTSATAVRSRLEAYADGIPGTGKYWLYGRLNSHKAVDPLLH